MQQQIFWWKHHLRWQITTSFLYLCLVGRKLNESPSVSSCFDVFLLITSPKPNYHPSKFPSPNNITFIFRASKNIVNLAGGIPWSPLQIGILFSYLVLSSCISCTWQFLAHDFYLSLDFSSSNYIILLLTIVLDYSFNKGSSLHSFRKILPWRYHQILIYAWNNQ